MDHAVRDEIEDLRALVSALGTIIKDTRQALLENQAKFEQEAKEIQGITALMRGNSGDSRDAMIEAIAAIADRIEKKTIALHEELSKFQNRIIDVETQAAQWRTRALTDALTRLPNRRAAEDVMASVLRGLATSLRQGAAIAIADIDRFKGINDTHGHIVGDAVLRFVAFMLRRNLRDEDFVARWGGEEFILIFRDIDLMGAHAICERLRKDLEQRNFSLRDSGKPIGKVTVSVGLTPLRADDTPEQAIDRADRALYAAKSSGRNTIQTIYP